MQRFSPSPDSTRWVLEFSEVPPYGTQFLRDFKVEDFDRWDAVAMWLLFLGPGSEVDGEIKIIVNSTIRRTLIIEKQIPFYHDGNPFPSTNGRVRVICSPR